MFYRKTPLGRIFFDYVGEPFLRGDLCNASPELGSILQHQGPVLDAEKRAAEMFGAERTYFVLNGTSTSNKMVTLALLAPGDLVLFDRNCHKSMHHGALMMAGAMPVYLNPTRDANGIIGPVDHRLLNEDYIRGQIAREPARHRPGCRRKERPFRLAILTNTTYDGVCYNEREVLDRIGKLCDYIIFDEAWMGYAKFHPLFDDRFGMSLDRSRPGRPRHLHAPNRPTSAWRACRRRRRSTCATRTCGDRHGASTTTASTRVFMMHTSTSPQYNMIASLDVGAEIMRGRPGFALMDEAVRESIALRKQIERYHDEIEPRDGGSQPQLVLRHLRAAPTSPSSTEQLEASLDAPWLSSDTRDTIAKAIADGGVEECSWREVSDDILASVPECWMFHEGDDWHDLDGLAPGYVMLDPTKCSITTPGIENGRAVRRDGHSCRGAGGRAAAHEASSTRRPASTPSSARHARHRARQVGHLAVRALDFKRAYDKSVALAERAAGPRRCPPGPLRNDEHPPALRRDARAPAEREGRRLAAGGLQRRPRAGDRDDAGGRPHRPHPQRGRAGPLDDLAGRVAANLVVVYPPGIAIMVPGERFAADSAAVAYLRLFEENDNLFPGFETEMQGIFPRREEDGSLRYYTYVVGEPAHGGRSSRR